MCIFFSFSRTRAGSAQGTRVHIFLSSQLFLYYVCKNNSVTGQEPAARSGHSCARLGDLCVFFGGVKDENYYNDVHVLDTKNWNWFIPPTEGVPPRCGCVWVCSCVCVCVCLCVCVCMRARACAVGMNESLRVCLYTHSLSLTLSLVCVYTHSLSLTLSLVYVYTHSFSHSLFLSHIHTHTHSLTLTLSHIQCTSIPRCCDLPPTLF